MTSVTPETAPLILPARRPVLTLLAAAMIAALAAAGTTRLRPGVSLRDLIARNDEASAALVRVVEDFSVTDDLTLLVTAPPAGGREAEVRNRLLSFATRLDAAVRADTDAARMCGNVRYRADQHGAIKAFIENVAVPNGLLYLTNKEFADVRERLTAPRMREQIARNEAMISAAGPAVDAVSDIVLRDPLRLYELIGGRFAPWGPVSPAGGDAFLAPDGRSMLIMISGLRPASDLEFSKAFVAAIKRAVARANPGGLTVEYTGAYAIADLSARLIRRDMIVSVICSVAFIQILFLFAFRHLLSFALVMIPVAVGILTGFGVFSLLSTSITPVTAVIGALLAGIGIDYSIHVLAHYGRSGGAAGARISAAVRRVRVPIATAAITSVLAFLAIAQSDVQALRDFGRVGALGLVGAFLATLFVLPALIVVLSRAAGLGLDGLTPRGRLEHLIVGVYRRRRGAVGLIIAIWLAALGVVAVSARGSLFESDLKVLHPRPNRALELEEVIADRFGAAPNALLVLLEADSDERLTTLAYEASRRLRTAQARAAGVVTVYSIADFLPDPAALPSRLKAIASIDADRVLHDFRAALEASLFDPKAYAGYEELLARLLAPDSPPTVEDLRTWAGGSYVVGRLLPRPGDGALAQPPIETLVVARLSSPLNDRERRAETITTVRRLLSDVPSAVVTGLSVIGYDTERLIRGELLKLLGLAAIAILALLILVFRNLVDVLLVLLPTAFAVTTTAAVMFLTGDRLNMINLVGLPLLVGIGVDGGIILVSIARRCRLAGAGRETLAAQLGASCHALAVTNGTTILAFGSLTFTSMPAVQSLGRLTAVGMGATLVATLFMLAPILIRFGVAAEDP